MSFYRHGTPWYREQPEPPPMGGANGDCPCQDVAGTQSSDFPTESGHAGKGSRPVRWLRSHSSAGHSAAIGAVKNGEARAIPGSCAGGPPTPRNRARAGRQIKFDRLNRRAQRLGLDAESHGQAGRRGPTRSGAETPRYTNDGPPRKAVRHLPGNEDGTDTHCKVVVKNITGPRATGTARQTKHGPHFRAPPRA